MQPAAGTPTVRRRPIPPELLRGLGGRFGERFTIDGPVRDRHGRDESPVDPGAEAPLGGMAATRATDRAMRAKFRGDLVMGRDMPGDRRQAPIERLLA